jgi:hypothetical protein
MGSAQIRFSAFYTSLNYYFTSAKKKLPFHCVGIPSFPFWPRRHSGGGGGGGWPLLAALKLSIGPARRAPFHGPWVPRRSKGWETLPFYLSSLASVFGEDYIFIPILQLGSNMRQRIDFRLYWKQKEGIAAACSFYSAQGICALHSQAPARSIRSVLLSVPPGSVQLERSSWLLPSYMLLSLDTTSRWS